ncbi:MAG TPA: AtpZ/AtpI family protein [Thermoanaerobaculia bacterium]|nr:AtpZ/AtpI family protein [Thermoanaerobaculia bacterium]
MADDDPGSARGALQVLALSFLFPAAVVVGLVAGRWLGERLGSSMVGGLLGAVVGAAAGFWQLYAFLARR